MTQFLLQTDYGEQWFYTDYDGEIILDFDKRNIENYDDEEDYISIVIKKSDSELYNYLMDKLIKNKYKK